MTALAEAPTSIPVDVPAQAIVVSASSFKRAMTNALRFAGRDYTLPVINAVRLKADAEARTLTVEATDRYKLLREVITLDEAADWEALVAYVDAQEFIQTIGMATRGLSSSMRPSLTATLVPSTFLSRPALTFKVGRFTLDSTELVQGSYPDTERLLVQNSGDPDGPVLLDAKHLIAFAQIDTGHSQSALQMTVGSKDKPIRFKDEDGRISGLFMPMRSTR